jgi:hypothetical protein
MERDHMDGTGIEERIILKWISKEKDEDFAWNDMVQNRDRWLVNVVVNVRCPQNTRIC